MTVFWTADFFFDFLGSPSRLGRLGCLGCLNLAKNNCFSCYFLSWTPLAARERAFRPRLPSKVELGRAFSLGNCKVLRRSVKRVGEKFQFDGARMRAVELELRSPAAQAGG